jgi:hypothetical protein
LLRNVKQRLEPEARASPPGVESREAAPAGSLALIEEPCAEELLIVIVLGEGEDGLTVVPVSPTVRMATEWDLYLPEELLGYPAVAQVWNQGLILPEQAAETVASVPPSTLDGLTRLVQAANASSDVPPGLTVGPPVLDQQDPRLLHQDAESQTALAYWGPTLALAGSSTLGQLVRHRRDELQVPSEDIEALARPDGWLGELEADTLDVARRLPAAALAGTMHMLRIAASRRLARIARWTIEAQAPGRSAALARQSAPGEPAEVLDVDGYVEDFMRELGRHSA